MILKLADIVIEVKSRYRYTYDICHDYLYSGRKPPSFSVFATNEQIADERKKSPGYSDDVLESTCIYRNICNELLRYDAILIHSAAICVDTQAYLFSAKSGTGKTTHVNLWLDKFGERAFIINGDKPILRKIDNKFYACGTPWCGKEGSNKNVCVPIKGICILERGADNKIDYAENKEALLFLLTQTPIPQKKESAEQMLDNLGKLIESVPVYRLRCNMELAACDVAYGAMSGDVIGKKAEF